MVNRVGEGWGLQIDDSGWKNYYRYEYDGRNFRTKKLKYNSAGTSVDETIHAYYNSSWQLLEERVDSATTPIRSYVWGQRYIDDLILSDREVDSTSIRLYAMNDVMFNVVALWDPDDSSSDGAVVERYEYDAYGNAYVLDENWGKVTNNVSAYDWDIRYASYRWDAESELYNVRNRYYHATMGVWLTRDPIGYEGGLNLYEYVKSKPISRIDPFGLDYIDTTGPNEDVAIYIDENWAGNDIASIGLGSIDKDTNTISFHPKFGLPDMPFEHLQDEYGDSYSNINAFLADLRQDVNNKYDKKYNYNNNWTGGRSVSDYWDLRLTCDKCGDLSGAAREQLENMCKSNILIRGKNYSAGYDSNLMLDGLGYAASAGGLIYAGDALRNASTVVLTSVSGAVLIGIVAISAAGLVFLTVKSIYDFKTAKEINDSAKKAAELYCNCDSAKEPSKCRQKNFINDFYNPLKTNE